MEFRISDVPITIKGTNLTGTSDTIISQDDFKKLLFDFMDQFLRKSASKSRDYDSVFIKDGVIVGQEESHGHKTTWKDTKVREATSEELEVYNATETIIEYLRNNP